jgi:aminoglycoside 6'-N-acetyltransferase I
MMNIREYRESDSSEWLRMRLELWPEDSRAGHESGMAEWRGRPDTIVLVAERADAEGLAGFAEVGMRPYADGCDTHPVAYLEGWYVDADARRQGVGSALIRAAEGWARQQGYREFASDALFNNLISQQAHEALGFQEVERAVLYRKIL